MQHGGSDLESVPGEHWAYSNLGTAPLNDITRNLDSQLFDGEDAFPVEDKTYVPAEASLKKIAGTYDLQGLILELKGKDGRLFLKMQGLPEISTIALSDTEFSVPAMDARITFIQEETRAQYSLILNMGSVNMKGYRNR